VYIIVSRNETFGHDTHLIFLVGDVKEYSGFTAATEERYTVNN
jgi:hypothetical protein